MENQLNWNDATKIISAALNDKSDPDGSVSDNIISALDDADLLYEADVDLDEIIDQTIQKHKELLAARYAGKSLPGMIYDRLIEVGSIMDPELEKQFEATAAQINLKLAEAAAALKEANRLADEAGLPALINSQWIREELSGKEFQLFLNKIDNIDISELQDEVEVAGWSTSSSYC